MSQTKAPIAHPTQGSATEHSMDSQGHIGVVGLMAVQGIIGYEWLVSGLAKIFGNFVPDFGAKLPDSAQLAPKWFKSILNSVVTPAPTFWAIVIEAGEFLIGAALIAAAVLLSLRFNRLSRLQHSLLVGVTGVAALSATVLAISLHVLNGGTHPWLLPANAFDEGVDLDSLLPAMQVVLFVVSLCLLLKMRRPSPEHLALGDE